MPILICFKELFPYTYTGTFQNTVFLYLKKIYLSPPHCTLLFDLLRVSPPKKIHTVICIGCLFFCIHQQNSIYFSQRSNLHVILLNFFQQKRKTIRKTCLFLKGEKILQNKSLSIKGSLIFPIIEKSLFYSVHVIKRAIAHKENIFRFLRVPFIHVCL